MPRYSPPKPPHYYSIHELKKGEFYMCRLSGKQVVIIDAKEPGFRGPERWEVIGRIYCEGAGYVDFPVINEQLYR